MCGGGVNSDELGTESSRPANFLRYLTFPFRTVWDTMTKNVSRPPIITFICHFILRRLGIKINFERLKNIQIILLNV